MGSWQVSSSLIAVLLGEFRFMEVERVSILYTHDWLDVASISVFAGLVTAFFLL